ncbi:MAG: SusC/RagA family TonB-linked outer membrane protein [Gemmatimonadales bacterium]|nr:SusC/RagA family TonB-linked outer membrane protein [Gemmatimonadales bacterium]
MVSRKIPGASVLGLLAAVLFAGQAQAQSTGSIAGTVVDALTRRPIGAAQVSVVGTNLATTTNSNGNYTLTGVAAGTVTLRILGIGYAEVSREISVTAGQRVTVDIQMQARAMELSPLVVTATGEQRRIEVGNAIAYVNAAEVVERQSISNMTDMLTARAAGVLVTPPIQTGGGGRIRIRGNSSMSLTNNPIFVIDGVRVEGTTGSSSIGVGGTTVSRMNDFNPEEIESIEVVRGPSAATLYGTDAANGVIVIRTKRGVAGRTDWSYYTEQAALSDRNKYPDAYWGWTAGSTRTNFTQCILSQVISGACVQDSVTMYNLHKDPEATPYGTGYRQQHGLQVRGGSDAVRYFMHGEFETEDGVTKIPTFDQRWLDNRGITLRPEQRNPNGLKRFSARSNLDVALNANTDVSVSLGYIQQETRLTRSDDSGVPGLATNTFGGHGYKYMTNLAGDTLHGYRTVTPREIYRTSTAQDVNRFIGSITAQWRPRSWLSGRGTYGIDFVGRKETQLCRFTECPVSGTDALGFKRDNRTNMFAHTLDAALTATRLISSSIESKTTVGVQYNRNTFDRNGAFGQELPPGATTVTSAAIKTSDESNSETRTIGAYIEQHIALNDRLFLTGALRSDRNSAFGADFKTVLYPKFSASWVVAQGRGGLVDQLRLRTAYGASGVQPSTTAAVQFYSPLTYVGESGEAPGLVADALGNRDLKPERSAELEVGFDATLFNNRVTAEVTWYNKKSTDALISRVLPPSLGTGATTRFENLGEVKNTGWEIMLMAQVIDGRSFGWDLALNGSLNSNELISLGGVPPGAGATSRNVEGYPLFGWWNHRFLGFEDKNGDGLIRYSADPNLNEVFLGTEPEYLGPSLPTREFALTSGIDLFRRSLRLSGQLDYKGGHLLYNNTERIRCQSRNNCRGLIDPNAPLFEQARTIAVRQFGTAIGGGAFMEKADFLRLRELSLSLRAPDRWAGLIGGRSLTTSLSVRNVAMLWTEYTGVDPEAMASTINNPSEFQAFGPPTYVSFRLTLGF